MGITASEVRRILCRETHARKLPDKYSKRVLHRILTIGMNIYSPWLDNFSAPSIDDPETGRLLATLRHRPLQF